MKGCGGAGAVTVFEDPAALMSATGGGAATSGHSRASSIVGESLASLQHSATPLRTPLLLSSALHLHRGECRPVLDKHHEAGGLRDHSANLDARRMLHATALRKILTAGSAPQPVAALRCRLAASSIPRTLPPLPPGRLTRRRRRRRPRSLSASPCSGFPPRSCCARSRVRRPPRRD